MSKTSPRLEGIRTKFKRKGWRNQIKDLLRDSFHGFIETGDEVEVVTRRDLTPAERAAIERIMERAEDG